MKIRLSSLDALSYRTKQVISNQFLCVKAYTQAIQGTHIFLIFPLLHDFNEFILMVENFDHFKHILLQHN